MTPDGYGDFFLAAAGVAGALIGLLFVAVSVAPQRVLAEGAARAQQVRASAALTSFVNALSVSLFALVPGVGLGWSVVAIGGVGVSFVAGSLFALVRDHGWRLPLRDYTMVAGLGVVFGLQTAEGLRIELADAGDGAVDTVAVLVVVCFLVGIARAWALIGGPTIRLRHEIAAVIRPHDDDGRA